MPRVVTEHRTLELSKSGRIAIVADTHSNPHSDAHAHLAREAPEAILHAGDIGRFEVIEKLSKIAPTHAVRGNIDDHRKETPDVIVLDLGRSKGPKVRILLTHIAVYGPKLRRDARALAEKHDAQLVICGHSHVPLIARDGQRVVFNPGSIGPRRFSLPITYGVLELDAKTGVALRHVDCETGERWLPPSA